MEPFIDTVVICTITALVMRDAQRERVVPLWRSRGNATLADGTVLSGVSRPTSSTRYNFSYVLTIAVVLFAFNSMI
ncbi:MAG: alanine:cation symporter family protein [Flavobacteriales bacterium]